MTSIYVTDAYLPLILSVPCSSSGITGPQGNTGGTGATGADGNTGSVGEIGATGPQGNTGVTGSQGEIGNTGVTGSQGESGATGAQGNTGATGADGNTGVTGSQGNTGATGADGNTGVTGSQGNTGVTGSQGNTGVTGSQGNTGVTGSQGNTGVTGADGNTGSQGVTGSQGNTGATGSVGETGATGSLSSEFMDAVVATNIPFVIANVTPYEFDEVTLISPGSTYNVATNEFVAGITGVYYYAFKICGYNTSATDTYMLSNLVQLNGVTNRIDFAASFLTTNLTSGQSYYVTVPMMGLIRMIPGDRLRLAYFLNPSLGAGNPGDVTYREESSFSIFNINQG